VLREWATSVDGHVIDPGLETFARVELTTGIRMAGVTGSVNATANGDATRLPAGMRESLINQLDGPISDAQRTAILTILGWNRTPAGGTSTTTATTATSTVTP
jgi:hypothetical protein